MSVFYLICSRRLNKLWATAIRIIDARNKHQAIIEVAVPSLSDLKTPKYVLTNPSLFCFIKLNLGFQRYSGP